jgi:hypothetical protein
VYSLLNLINPHKNNHVIGYIYKDNENKNIKELIKKSISDMEESISKMKESMNNRKENEMKKLKITAIRNNIIKFILELGYLKLMLYTTNNIDININHHIFHRWFIIFNFITNNFHYCLGRFLRLVIVDSFLKIRKINKESKLYEEKHTFVDALKVLNTLLDFDFSHPNQVKAITLYINNLENINNN